MSKCKILLENFQLVSVVVRFCSCIINVHMDVDVEVPNVSLLSCSMVTWRSAWLVVEWVCCVLIQLLSRLNY